jgi:hypothetical protein
VLVRLRTDPDTRAYVARRTAEGKSRRDAKRCLRRIIARQLYRLLERYDQPGVEILRATLTAHSSLTLVLVKNRSGTDDSAGGRLDRPPDLPAFTLTRQGARKQHGDEP